MNVAEVTERLPVPSRRGAPGALGSAGGIDAGIDDWSDDRSDGWVDDWINGWVDVRGGGWVDDRVGGRIASPGLRERVHTSTFRSLPPLMCERASIKRSSPAPICMHGKPLDIETAPRAALTRQNVTFGDRVDAWRVKITAHPAS